MVEELSLPVLRVPQRVDNPVQSARLARVALRVEPDDPVPHLVARLEGDGFIVLALPIELPQVDAFSCWVDLDGQNRPLIALSAGKPGDRLRFSVAHELGHLCMHHGLERQPLGLEREADQFAAEFLMPEAAMRGVLSPSFTLTNAARLKVEWGVSMQALIRRARDLSVINERRYRYLFEQLGRLGWKQREPVNLDIPAERPQGFRKMAELYHGQSRLAARIAATMLVDRTIVESVLAQYDGGRTDYGEASDYLEPLARRLSRN